MPYFEYCLKKANIQYIISEDAFDIHGNRLVGYSAIMIPKNINQDKNLLLFYKYFNTLTGKYEKYVASVVGLSKEEIFQRKRYMPLMLGSEKIYFPDKLNEIYGNYHKFKKMIL